eukprot:Amastigsp_a677504_11.p1 type:complete len:193 gc:universal Amastigsp_a677504_11:154-732(+)
MAWPWSRSSFSVRPNSLTTVIGLAEQSTFKCPRLLQQWHFLLCLLPARAADDPPLLAWSWLLPSGAGFALAAILLLFGALSDDSKRELDDLTRLASSFFAKAFAVSSPNSARQRATMLASRARRSGPSSIASSYSSSIASLVLPSRAALRVSAASPRMSSSPDATSALTASLSCATLAIDFINVAYCATLAL